MLIIVTTHALRWLNHQKVELPRLTGLVTHCVRRDSETAKKRKDVTKHNFVHTASEHNGHINILQTCKRKYGAS